MVRTRRAGDYITINKELDRKSLKDYLMDEKVPKEERNNIALIADGSHIVWVVGHRISWDYKVTTKYDVTDWRQQEESMGITWYYGTSNKVNCCISMGYSEMLGGYMYADFSRDLFHPFK